MVEQLESHTYSANMSPDWCIGTGIRLSIPSSSNPTKIHSAQWWLYHVPFPSRSFSPLCNHALISETASHSLCPSCFPPPSLRRSCYLHCPRHQTWPSKLDHPHLAISIPYTGLSTTRAGFWLSHTLFEFPDQWSYTLHRLRAISFPSSSLSSDFSLQRRSKLGDGHEYAAQ